MSIHLDLEFRFVLTVVIAFAVGVAGWRFVWDALRRSRSSGEGADDGIPGNGGGGESS